MGTQENSKTKILVKVHEPLIAIMQHKIDAACLKRDAYLDKALRVEAEFLRKEIATPNSDKAKNYIAAQLSDLKLKPLNLLLSTETVDLINEVCKEKNVPRDAFMNRFFLLLIANDTILTALLSEFLEVGYAETAEEFLADGASPANDPDGEFYRVEYLFFTHNSIDALESFISKFSPFLKVRLIINSRANDNQDNEKISQYKDAMYSYPFPKKSLKNLSDDYDFLKLDNALGFNPFMSDETIEEIKNYDRLLSDLDDLMESESKKDKLIEIMEKEKKLRAEKEKQARQRKLEKAQAKEGEQK